MQLLNFKWHQEMCITTAAGFLRWSIVNCFEGRLYYHCMLPTFLQVQHLSLMSRHVKTAPECDICPAHELEAGYKLGPSVFWHCRRQIWPQSCDRIKTLAHAPSFTQEATWKISFLQDKWFGCYPQFHSGLSRTQIATLKIQGDFF